MPDKFNMNAAPFDRLSTQEQERLRASLDVAYYRENETILKPGQTGTALHILIKGGVEERSGDNQEIFAHYANDDLFDVRAQLEGTVKHKYIALEDTLSYLLPSEVFIELYQTNPKFSAYFDSNLSKRQELVEAAQKQQNLGEFILTKVDDSIYHPVLILDHDEPLNAVTKLMKERSIDSALVRLEEHDPRLAESSTPYTFGIITRTNMLHAVMLNDHPLDTPVGTIATFPVYYIEDGDFLFNAMITMTRQRMKRVMVCNGNEPVGMLDMTQILSSFSTHSHVLSLSIARAQTIEELALAANRQRHLVESLINNGIRTRFIMELISAINEQIIEKAFHLIVPSHMHDKCCLIVLGSEGRGEQVLKTDQDNALILQDGVEWAECQEVMERFTHTLQQLGYPLCPGKVMVNNPDWVHSQSDWQRTVTRWITKGTAENVMKLAILTDAHAVAGNQELLDPVAQHISDSMKNNMLVLLDFTRPALQFSLPLTLFGNVKKSKDGLDIKRGGIFPIVHGIRALSLEYALIEKNTFDRIEALQKKRILEPDTADNLTEALKLFFKLRLAQQLSEHHSGNNIELKLPDRSERDLLRHSLHVVKKFKQWLGYHYQIRD